MGAGAASDSLDVDVASSRHPQNRPGVSQVVLEVVEVVVVVVVTSSVVVLSLQPNQPGVSHVEVVDVDVEVVVVSSGVVVVDLSRQPHHPGVSHVVVLVRVLDDVDSPDVVVVSVLLLSYIFH
jgi:hypothetical protein